MPNFTENDRIEMINLLRRTLDKVENLPIETSENEIVFNRKKNVIKQTKPNTNLQEIKTFDFNKKKKDSNRFNQSVDSSQNENEPTQNQVQLNHQRKIEGILEAIQTKILLHDVQFNNLEEDVEQINSFLANFNQEQEQESSHEKRNFNAKDQDQDSYDQIQLTKALLFHITKAKEQIRYLKSLQIENAGFIEDIHKRIIMSKRILQPVLEKYETFCDENRINSAKFLEILMEMAPDLYNKSQIINLIKPKN